MEGGAATAREVYVAPGGAGFLALFAEATVADASGRTFTMSSPVEIVAPK